MRHWLIAGLLAAASLSIPAQAQKDDVEFFSSIHVTADHPVKDAVCFFCSVEVDGTVNGDLVALFSHVRLNGEAKQDAVTLFSSIDVADNSIVGGDMVNVFGSVRVGENVSVGKDFVVMFGSLRRAATMHVGGDSVHVPGLVVSVPFMFLVLIVWLIVHEVRRRRTYPAGYPPPPPYPPSH